MPAGKLMSFMLRVVVGVDGRRRHAPLRLDPPACPACSGRAALELVAAIHVAEQVVALHGELRVVAPLVGIADLVADTAPASLGLLSWCASLIHGSCWMSSPSDLSSAATSFVMLSLAAGGKFSLTQSCPTASPSAWSVSRCNASSAAVSLSRPAASAS